MIKILRILPALCAAIAAAIMFLTMQLPWALAFGVIALLVFSLDTQQQLVDQLLAQKAEAQRKLDEANRLLAQQQWRREQKDSDPHSLVMPANYPLNLLTPNDFHDDGSIKQAVKDLGLTRPVVEEELRADQPKHLENKYISYYDASLSPEKPWGYTRPGYYFRCEDDGTTIAGPYGTYADAEVAFGMYVSTLKNLPEEAHGSGNTSAQADRHPGVDPAVR